MTSNRREHKQQVEEADKGLRPMAGRKGGEKPTGGHGPSTQENRESSNDGGKEKRKKKED
jgi:hypothetical protein